MYLPSRSGLSNGNHNSGAYWTGLVTVYFYGSFFTFFLVKLFPTSDCKGVKFSKNASKLNSAIF